MKLRAKRIFRVMLWMALLLIPSHVSAQEQSQGQKASAGKADTAPETPQLADVVPLAADLTVRLAILEREMKDGLDVSPEEKAFERLQVNLENHADQVHRRMESKDYSYNKLVEIRVLPGRTRAIT